MGYEAAKKLIALIERPKTTLREPVMVGGILYTGGTVCRMKDEGHA